MKRAALLLLMLVPLASGGGVHGDVSTPTSLTLHWGDQDAAALHPSTPSVANVPEASSASACGEPATWYAIFTEDDPSDGIEWSGGLARDATFDGRSRLTFVFESVVPGTTTPLGLPPTKLNLTAAMFAGYDPANLGSGTPLANGHTLAAPTALTVANRSVYSMWAMLTWAGDAVIPADGGFHLQFSLAVGEGEAACTTNPPGIRPYSADGNHSVFSGFVLGAVNVESFEVDVDGMNVTAQLFASSPWGTGALAVPETPILNGPRGVIEGPVLAAMDFGANLSATWTWDAAGQDYGTYAMEITIQDVQGTPASDKVIFQLVAPAVVEEPPEEEPLATKKSPAIGALVPVLLVALGRRLRG